jgi:hypothetical protein
MVCAAAVCKAGLMGKRSTFERREADFYPTLRTAVVPLIPYLRLHRIRSFAEPCAGDGALVRHPKSSGALCVYSGDLRTGNDALAVSSVFHGQCEAVHSRRAGTCEQCGRRYELRQRVGNWSIASGGLA